MERTAMMLDHALALATQGQQVLPLHSIRDGKCSCGKDPCERKPGKHPRTRNGEKDATMDAEQIRRWWNAWPDANIGIGTGERSDLLVLDIDTKDGHGKDGVGAWQTLIKKHGSIPNTFIVKTGSGGMQVYFKYPKGSGITIGSSKAHQLGVGIDWRGNTGYVVAPPSNHVSGGTYEVLNDAPPAECPSWIWMPLVPAPKEEKPDYQPPARKPTRIEVDVAYEKLQAACRRLRDIPEDASGDGSAREAMLKEGKLVGGLWPLAPEVCEAALLDVVLCQWEKPYTPAKEAARHIHGAIAIGTKSPLDLQDAIAIREGKSAPPEPPKLEGVPDIATRLLSLGKQVEKHLTGIPTLDGALRGGLRPGDIVFVGGAPGAGKTSLCVQLAVRYAQLGKPVMILAADEGPNSIAVRVGQLLGFSRDELEEGTVNQAAAEAVSSLPMQLLDASDGVTIEHAAEQLKGPGFLIVDSIQTARTKTSHGAKDARTRLDDVIGTVKHVATKHGHIVLATSELARGAYRSKATGDQINALAAFKESGSIEYAGQLLLVLTTPKGDGGVIDVETPKNRIGTGRPSFRLQLDAMTSGLKEVPKPEDAPEEPTAQRWERLLALIWHTVRDNEIASVDALDAHIRKTLGLAFTQAEIRQAANVLKGSNEISGPPYHAQPSPRFRDSVR